MARSLKNYLLIAAKGLAMGAADVVPGVSGGTIAFITGIYEELIDSIKQANLASLKVLQKDGIAAFWTHVNGWFLLSLLSGIGISIASLAKLITHLLENYPTHIWSFFFGLVFASIFFVGKQVKKWNVGTALMFVLGAAIAYYITILPASQSNDAYWYIFLSGMIAICAMILPGISGSFILLLMGAYETVLNAIHERNIVIIAVFGSGAIVGLLSFARLLKFMFHKYHDLTIAVLSGFLLGSLNKIWPWKETLSTFIKHVGEPNEKVVPLEQVSVLPGTFEELTGEPSHLMMALLLAIVGAGLIALMEFAGAKNTADS